MNRDTAASNVSSLDSSIAERAAGFFRINYSGPHAIKRIQRDFSISPGMAKLLRDGKGWTVARLDQASRLFGKAFRDVVWPPTADEIHDRLDRIEQLLLELRNEQGKSERLD